MDNFDLIKKFIVFSYCYTTSLFNWTDWKGTHEGYVPDFIQDIDWTCNVGHMIDIWNNKVLPEANQYGRINRLWECLDDENQHKLVDYIVNNYKG